MAKFTRTVYAANAREVAEAIASQASLYDLGPQCPKLSSPPVSTRKTDEHRKRLRITILVEPEAPPAKRTSKPRRPRPVQLELPVVEMTGDGRETRFLVPASAVLGGA